MDPISQAAIGATAAQSFSRKTGLNASLVAGAIGGTMPDLDVLIRSTEDPLLFLDYHRHFTHSLMFIPLGGVIAAAVGRVVMRGRHTVRELWLPATLGWATHGLLDSCTSYGTFLLWPFSSARIAWHNVAIIDPLFTLPLVAAALLAVRRKNRSIARFGFVLGILYLLFGVVQRNRASAVHSTVQADRNHAGIAAEVKPSLANNFLFRGFYEYDGHYYADAIRVPWFGEPQIYEGDKIKAINIDKVTEGLEALHAEDIRRFARFSNGFLVRDPRNPGIISDFRYAAVPNRIAPLWGVDLGAAEPGKHLNFHRFNAITPAMRKEFEQQLKGERPD